MTATEAERVVYARRIHEALSGCDTPTAIEILIGLVVMSAQARRIPCDLILKAVTDCWQVFAKKLREEQGDA